MTQRFELEPEVRDWRDSLSDSGFKRADKVASMLAEKGPGLGGPWSDHLEGAVWELRLRLHQAAVRVTCGRRGVGAIGCGRMAAVTTSNGPAITVAPAAELPGSLRGALHRLFDGTYAQADHGYLDKSLELLRWAAVAAADDATGQAAAGTSSGEQIIGFALGETRILDLPGLPGQRVGLAGLCCVHSAYRRRGLFRMLVTRVIADGMDRPGGGRLLVAGRMAHPASLRIMNGNCGALPRPGVVPTAFQQDAARAVASCFAVDDFDPLAFICRGRGRPIGYPRMDIDADAQEWKLFAGVDRDRGDSLLALSWVPDMPPGW